MRVPSRQERIKLMEKLSPEKWKVNDDKRWTLILVCAHDQSRVKTENPFPEKCLVITVTIKDDFTTQEGFQKVRRLIK